MANKTTQKRVYMQKSLRLVEACCALSQPLYIYFYFSSFHTYGKILFVSDVSFLTCLLSKSNCLLFYIPSTVVLKCVCVLAESI